MEGLYPQHACSIHDNEHVERQVSIDTDTFGIGFYVEERDKSLSVVRNTASKDAGKLRIS